MFPSKKTLILVEADYKSI